MSTDDLSWSLDAVVFALACRQAQEKGMTLTQYLSELVTATVTGREAQSQRNLEMWQRIFEVEHAVA